MTVIMIIDSLRTDPPCRPSPPSSSPGASSGIGATYADRFARRGHDLVLVARDKARMEDLAERLRRETGVAVDVLPADLTDAGQMRTVEVRLRDDRRIGILINNAGANVAGAFAEQSPEDIERLVTLNATSVMRLARAVAPRFAEAGEGAIVNIGSVVGLVPEFGSTVYGATKAFVQFLSQGLAHELGLKGVYVQAVLPAAHPHRDLDARRCGRRLAPADDGGGRPRRRRPGRLRPPRAGDDPAPPRRRPVGRLSGRAPSHDPGLRYGQAGPALRRRRPPPA